METEILKKATYKSVDKLLDRYNGDEEIDICEVMDEAMCLLERVKMIWDSEQEG